MGSFDLFAKFPPLVGVESKPCNILCLFSMVKHEAEAA